MKTITILGSTGSVGVNTLSVVREHRAHFKVLGLAASSNATVLAEQIEEFSPKAVYLENPVSAAEISKKYSGQLKIFTSQDTLKSFSAYLNSDILVAASSGTSSLLSVMGALRSGKRVALANKEILVMAGSLVMECLKNNPGASLIPVDSEHNAIFQCLQGQSLLGVRKLILTGSGGPLRRTPESEFKTISKQSVISHPRWKMGQKISVDSATMMNKGLEIIEASWLFDMPISKIEVLIHPEAVIHSMVEFVDGSVLAQLGVTDMRLPIRHALSYPERLGAPSMSLDWSEIASLTFAAPDRKKFPCLNLAYEAAKKSGSAPCVLSAADETVVRAYLEDRVSFLDIPRVIEKVMSGHRHIENPGLEEIQSIHHWAVEETKKYCGEL